MSDINGFEIDEYNIYKLDTKKRVSKCPLCSPERKKKNDPCLMLDWDRGLGTCQHCGEVIQLHTFKKRDNVEDYKLPPQKKVDAVYSDGMVNWFDKRGIKVETLRRLKIREGKEWMPQTKKEENCIKFNYYLGDELVNVKYRDGAKNFKLFKGAEKIFYNINSMYNEKRVVIVEGEMDVCALTQSGVYSCISVPNGATKKAINLDYLDSCYEYFEGVDEIVIWADNDQPGENLKNELIRRFGAHRCLIVKQSDTKDANEMLVKYGSMSVQEAVEGAEPVPLENVDTVRDHYDQLIDFFENGAEKGAMIGLKDFDKVFSALTGQTIVVTGIPSHGKSGWVDQMCIGYNLNYGWKGAFVSEENRPIHLHSAKLFRKIAGYTPKKKEKLDKVAIDKVIDHMDKNFFHVWFHEEYYLDDTLKKLEELIYRKGIKYFVLDPFNKIHIKGKDSWDSSYVREYLQKFNTFCRKHDVLGILVAHPAKIRDNVGGDIREPNAYDIKGASEFYDMSPNILLVHRLFKKNLVKVKVLKVKFDHLGTNQGECFFGWNYSNGRYMKCLTDPKKDMIEHHRFEVDNTNYLETFSKTKEEEVESEVVQVDIFDNNDDDGFGDVSDDLPF